MEERKQKIRSFLARHVRNHDLRDDEDIFAVGFVNSLVAMQLIDFIEKSFGISVTDEDLDLDNFRTIDRIEAFVEHKTGTAA